MTTATAQATARPKRPDKDKAGRNKKARSAIQECPYNLWVELQHSTEYPDDYGQVEPAANTRFRVTFGNGQQTEGRLDQNGSARFEGIPDGNVQVEYEPDIDQQVEELKQQLRQGLDEILDAEREEYHRLEKELEDARLFGQEFPGSNTLARGAKYTGALLQGIGNGVAGLLGFAWDVLKGSGKVLYELGLRLNPITAPQKFKEDLQALKQAYHELKRFADEDLEAYVILMGEAETYAMLQQFGADLLAAQHSLELTEAGGELIFDVALAVFTAGAGAAASARHVGKLKKLKSIVDKLVDALKRKRRHKKRDRDTPNRKIVTRVQLRKVPCFCPYNRAFKRLSPHEKKSYLREYDRQLQRQQDAINKMSVDEYQTAREAYSRQGRNPLADDLQESTRADIRDEIKSSIMKSLNKQGIGPVEADRQADARADSIMKKLAALHEPDMVAGGWHAPKPEVLGDSRVNSSIGGSWNQKGRLATIDQQALQAKQAGHGQSMMNIRLDVCRGRRHCP
jgi:hypothetical protein